MDALSEDFERTDGDTLMTMLTHEDITEEDPGIIDEEEDLRNSLREAVHDEAVRPKMQCLMMDPSFSMVTVQGEDSGIEWETTPSRCTTPWVSEAGNTTLEFSSPVMRAVTPGSVPAGRIIFIMDEEQILKRKKSKGSGRRTRAEKPKEPPLEDLDEVSGRPELVEVSLPNVKVEGEGEEEAAHPSQDVEQLLFRLVSEGSEILNIVVPPKFATVDEEESTVMVDNLSYLEETPVIKSTEESNDDVFDEAPAGSGGGKQVEGSHLIGPNVMDPPGAPVTRPLMGGATGNVDYFEKFTLIDAQAPGSPAVVKQGQEKEQTEEDGEIQDSSEPEQPKGKSTPVTVTVDEGTTETISGEEIASELLDEIFYGGTDDHLLKGSQDRGEECKVDGRMSPRSPLKKSGSALFGSQEDILTPIFLPEGPPKIIDLILLEEPKAMAFLYSDLYEEAMGNRQKDEDTESMTSEKSFHSRHSDREARGYLEKYVLKDETPVVAVEVEPAYKENYQEGGIRMLSQDSYSDFLPSPEEGGVLATEEEITDFFRSCANSSPCDIEPFPPTQEEENVAQSKKKRKDKEKKLAAKTAVPQTQVRQPTKATEKETLDPLGVSSYEPFSALSDGEIERDFTKDVQTQPLPLSEKTQEGMSKPVAPPRRKAASAPKTSLDLTPLTPVEEGEECGGKEQREEEKEKASPAETADEGEGDGDETGQASSIVALSDGVPALIGELTEASETEIVQGDTNTETVDGETKSARAEGNDIEPKEEEKRETETAKGETGPEMADSQLADSAQTEVEPERGEDSGSESAERGASKSPSTSVTEPAKESGRCIIL